MSKICLVCVSLRAGGTERIVSRMATYLRKHHAVSVLLLSRATPFYELPSEVSLIQPDISNKRSAGWKWYLYILSYIQRSLSTMRPDLVLCFGESIASATLLIAKFYSDRVIVFNRANPTSSMEGSRGIINPLIYPVADKVVVQTSRAVQIMKPRYRFSKFEVLPNPIQVPDNVTRFEDRPKHIISIGTLGGKKNQKALISAFATLKDCHSWKLNIVGDGPDRAYLERLSENLGVSDNVFFYGQCQDVYKFLNESRVFALTSLSEGFPNALAEALSAGCACISYDCPTGPSELIRHNINGILVPNGDEAKFQSSLEELVENEFLQINLSLNARSMIVHYSQDIVFKKLDSLLETSLKVR
ncbi:glycosyltransferase [Halomonas maura]|uniref:glycosyltransferase n=1 Tax=Halomonas maura TaxID=117606 RepID=UPI0025B4845E|nr:glycosyltransferase [Halomonas maura]MDN3555227.1 glycosyltransferase [Halomonas maura]